MSAPERTMLARDDARRILTSTDPAVHAAMLDALVRAGVLTETPDRKVRWAHSATRPGRIDEEIRRTYLGPWEVAP